MESLLQNPENKMLNSSKGVQLNGFHINLSTTSLKVFKTEINDISEFQQLRDSFSDNWFFYRKGIDIFALPRSETKFLPFKAEPFELNVHENLQLVVASINDVLPNHFPADRRVVRYKPFTFLGNKDELIEQASTRFSSPPSILKGIKIWRKFEIEAKIISDSNDSAVIGLFTNIGARWEITATLDELIQAGVDLTGFFVIRRERLQGQRGLIGRISRIEGSKVYLSESFDELDSIEQAEVQLEGSKAAVLSCLKQILGNRYEHFSKLLTSAEAELYIGPAADSLTDKMGSFLQNLKSISVTPEVSFTVGSRIEIKNTEAYKSIVSSPPVEFCFDASRTKKHTYPWPGLQKYGPFSRDIFPKKSPKILVVFPDTAQGDVEKFLKYLRDGIPGQYSKFTGISQTFHLINPTFVYCKVPVMGKSRMEVHKAYREKISEFLSEYPETLDIAITVILDEHSLVPDNSNPYLVTKASLLTLGIPVQEVRYSTIKQSETNLQYTLQNIGVALYAKLSGTPWTVNQDNTISDELVIGIGYCEFSESRFEEKQRFVGITTVFRGDGNYLLGNISKECSFDEYPSVLRSSTLKILKEVKLRNGWQPGDTVRLIFHAYRPMKKVDMAKIMLECSKLVGQDQNIEFAFINISQDHPFSVFDKNQLGIAVSKNNLSVLKGINAPERGTIVQIGPFTRLLCTTGPQLMKRNVTPHPRPLLIHLHPESTFNDLTYLSEQVLKFTSLSWRSVFPAKKPVTVFYSELIAGLLTRLRRVPDFSVLTIETKLQASRWFL